MHRYGRPSQDIPEGIEKKKKEVGRIRGGGLWEREEEEKKREEKKKKKKKNGGGVSYNAYERH